MGRSYFGRKLFTLTLLGATLFAGVAAGAPNGTPAKGLLVKAEVNAAPAFALQTTSFQGTDAGETLDYSFSSPMALMGPVVGLNLGYAPSTQLRWGLRGSGQLGMAFAGGDGIPWTGLDGQLRYTIGPTLGVRLAPSSPLELEFGLGFAAQMVPGSQAAIGSPDNGYPLGQTQYGVDGLARVIWRPWGAKSIVGFQGGVDLGWAMVPSSQTSTHGFLVAPEIGLVIGL